MIVLADESVNRFVVRELRNQGLQVISIAEECPGIRDQDVIAMANNKQALLVTADRDFGDLVFRDRHQSHFGVLLLRIDELNNEEQAKLVATTFLNPSLRMEGNFSVLKPRTIRIRPFAE